MTQVLREEIAGESHTPLRYQCSPYHLNSALYPIIEQLEFAAGFAREDTPEQKLEKLEAMLAGDVQLAAPSLSKFEKFTKKFRIFDLPFVFQDVNAVDKFQNSDAGQDEAQLRSNLEWRGAAP